MKIYLTLLCFLATTFVTAQITGYVTDERNQPLVGAVVLLHKATDSSVVNTSLTNKRGQFSFVKQAGVYVQISFTGYQTINVAIADGNTNTGVTSLTPFDNTLQGVTVQSSKPIIDQLTDRSVITINSAVLKMADNAMELISLAPGLQISDNEDAISLSGKDAVAVMINDKLVRLSSRDLVKLLKSMPAASLSQLEIMNNPSSKYDLPGNTALLNFKTRKNILRGFNGSVDAYTGQGGHNWGDLSALINYGTEKLALSGYLAYHYGTYKTWYSKEMKLNNGILYQQNTSLDKWSDPVLRLTVDYYINPKQTIGGLIEREASTNTGSYLTASQLNGLNYHTIGTSPNKRNWNTYNLNYRYLDTIGNELTIDLDRSDFLKDDQSNIDNAQNKIWYNTQTDISITTLKADYTYTAKNKFKLEAGAKVSGVYTDNNLTQTKASQNNLFNYSEKVNSLYTNIGKQYNKWGWQAGLRFEDTRVNGLSMPAIGSIIQQPDSSYVNLLPSFYISFTPGDVHQFRLSLNRGIKRPDYNDLQPFTYQIDPYNYSTGNPSLRVQRNTSLELGYTYKQKITFTSTYNYTTDFFTAVMYQSGTVTYQTVQNSGLFRNWNTNLNYPLKITKWWNSANKASVVLNHYKGQLMEGFLDQRQLSFQLSTSQRFNLPKAFQLQVSARYSSPSQNLIYSQSSNANVSMNISRKLFNEQGSIRLTVSDIFNTQRNDVTVNFGKLSYTQFNRWESQRIGLDFSWRFGNSKIKKVQDRETGNGDEKSRSGK